MKILTWNCQGAYRNKSEIIASYKPDIAVIQECECPDRLIMEGNILQPTANTWFGDLAYNPHKGISIMSYTGLEFSVDESYDPSVEYCIPINVSGHTDLNILAVWAMNHEDRKKSYIGQVYQAVDLYREFIRSEKTIIIGDFNSNQIWDRTTPGIANHTAVVKALKELDKVSIYHEINNEEHGSEKQKTFFMNRKNEGKTYHIDYCFLPSGWITKVKFFEVGEYDTWTKLSDHSPLMIEI